MTSFARIDVTRAMRSDRLGIYETSRLLSAAIVARRPIAIVTDRFPAMLEWSPETLLT